MVKYEAVKLPPKEPLSFYLPINSERESWLVLSPQNLVLILFLVLTITIYSDVSISWFHLSEEKRHSTLTILGRVTIFGLLFFHLISRFSYLVQCVLVNFAWAKWKKYFYCIVFWNYFILISDWPFHSVDYELKKKTTWNWHLSLLYFLLLAHSMIINMSLLSLFGKLPASKCVMFLDGSNLIIWPVTSHDELARKSYRTYKSIHVSMLAHIPVAHPFHTQSTILFVKYGG